MLTAETILGSGETLKGAGDEPEGVEDRDVARDSRSNGLVGLESCDSGGCGSTRAAAGRDWMKRYTVPSFDPIAVPPIGLPSTPAVSDDGSSATLQDFMTRA